MEYEPLQEKAPVNSEELAIRTSQLVEAAQRRERKIVAAKQQLRSVLQTIGEDLPRDVKYALESYDRADTPDLAASYRQHQQEKKSAIYDYLGDEGLAVDGTYAITRRTRVDYDMAGAYDRFTSYKLTRQCRFDILETSEREAGYTSSRGDFDETANGPTFFFGELLGQPLEASALLEDVPRKRGGKLDFAQCKLADWSRLHTYMEDFHEKLQTDKLADECSRLLANQPWQTGTFGSEQTQRQLVISGPGEVTWTIGQERYFEDDTYSPPVSAWVSHSIGERRLESAKLDIEEGKFWSENERNVFISYLSVIQSLVNSRLES